MIQIVKGDKQYVQIKFFKRGFFGGHNLVSEGFAKTQFIKSNICEDKVVMSNGSEVYVTMKVQKPSRPLTYEVLAVDLVKYPKYQHDKFVEEELIKKYMPFEKPTQSEIMEWSSSYSQGLDLILSKLKFNEIQILL